MACNIYTGCKENPFYGQELTSRIDFTVLLFLTCPSGKLKTEFTSRIAKSTSPGLSDTTFFARCIHVHVHFVLFAVRWNWFLVSK